jgi:hypothetical protein
MDAREDNIIEAEIEPSTKVHMKVKPSTKLQVMAETQQRPMEIERHE